MAPTSGSTIRRVLHRTVILSALGYFVDIYDLLLFLIVRKESLTAIGIPQADQLDAGVLLLNWQMSGLLLGGLLWGILGDKRGRVQVLFGSILLYSVATLANAFVTNLPAYAALRFAAGIGLAGELGAAITLVSETLGRELRGYGTAIVAAFGILGAVVAALVGNVFHWQVAYLVGGGLGLLLLLARFTIRDSRLYRSAASTSTRRGDLTLLFSSWERTKRYAYSLLVGLPVWFVIGILVGFAPELAVPLRVRGAILVGTAVLFCYLGASVGDLASGFLSQWLRSRRTVLIAFLTLTSALIYLYVFSDGLSSTAFYGLCFGLGFGAGYWAVFVTNAAEQFGTNLRATVATTAPNFARGAAVPLTLSFQFLAGPLGIILSAMIVGQATVLIALFAVRQLRETYGRDLDFLENHTTAPDAPRKSVAS